MKQEALNALDHDAFAPAVRGVLEDGPVGLRSGELYSALGEHHTATPMKYLHVQLAELLQSRDIVPGIPKKRYLHPKYATEYPGGSITSTVRSVDVQ